MDYDRKHELEDAGPARPQAKSPKRRRTGYSWLVAAVSAALVIALFSAYDTDEKGPVSTPRPSPYRSGASRSSGASSSRSRTYSARPTCPPVNREKAMTKEQAERLSGTGYMGTRPNSSAEISKLKIAQLKCKNCGYHTDNGSNTLCDYCAWMEEYGGGLPTETAPGTKPKPTSRTTPKPSATREGSDPHHADDYSHPDDFYYDHYDDFWDYEEAEDYWKKHH